MGRKSESGAVIIEATLSLTFFMFAIFTIYSMIHISMAQARISAALNATAKEISQYSYVYDLTGLNEKQAGIAANGGAAESILSDNLSEVNSLFDAFQGLANGTMSIASSAENTESFLYYILNEGIDQAKGSAVGELARMLMKKNFGAHPDKFLRRLGVEGGMNGLSFAKSRIFSGGTDSDIFLDVQYKVSVIKLLGIDMKMNFELCAKTRAWCDSDAVIASEESSKNTGSSASSVWDSDNVVSRGKTIVQEEKKNYTYTGSKDFDAYNNANGSNEFVSIVSVNTHEQSYQSAAGIRRVISSAYSNLSAVGYYDEKIVVQDKNGQSVAVPSDKATRTYRIVVVVPEDADTAVIQQVKAEFEADNKDATIEIKPGYGSPKASAETGK